MCTYFFNTAEHKQSPEGEKVNKHLNYTHHIRGCSLVLKSFNGKYTLLNKTDPGLWKSGQ